MEDQGNCDIGMEVDGNRDSHVDLERMQVESDTKIIVRQDDQESSNDCEIEKVNADIDSNINIIQQPDDIEMDESMKVDQELKKDEGNAKEDDKNIPIGTQKEVESKIANITPVISSNDGINIKNIDMISTEASDNMEHDRSDHEMVTEQPQQQQQSQSQKKQQEQDNNNLDSLSSGRNRRVRQKNRYFLDFHCIDLTKGGRSNKDDYDTFTTPSAQPRSSTNRSSTNLNTNINDNNTNGSQQDETELFEAKYCRKCSAKTCFDKVNGCQGCVYRKIVEASKKQKPSSQRSRSGNSKNRRHHQDDSPKQSSNHITKRKAAKPRTTQNSNPTFNQNTNQILDNTCINDNALDEENQAGKGELASCNNIFKANITYSKASQLPLIESIGDSSTINKNSLEKQDSITSAPIQSDACVESSSTKNLDDSMKKSNNLASDSDNSASSNNTREAEDSPKLDSWTPKEVAEFISSKGFTNEAELFRTQSVDGISLLLMQRLDFTQGLKIKLGPALKIYDQVCKLKREYFLRASIQA